MRTAYRLATFFVIAIAVTARADDDEIDFSVSRPPARLEKKSDRTNSVPQRLPEKLEGVVVDENGDPVNNATVILMIERVKDLFETKAEPEKWTATTNDHGVYILLLGPQEIEAEDDVVLLVRAEQFVSLDITLDTRQPSALALPEVRLRSQHKNIDHENPWNMWVDDTNEFNSEVAATVNGEDILNGDVISRYGNYIKNLLRQVMQESARSSHMDNAATPKEFEQFRADLVLRDLPNHIQQMALAQYYVAHLQPEELARSNRKIDKLFAKEVKRLKLDLHVSSQEDLEAELNRSGIGLNRRKQNFARKQYALWCVRDHTRRIRPIEDDEILNYHLLHIDQFQKSETVDWEKVGFRTSGRLAHARAMGDLKRVLASIADAEPPEQVFKQLSKDRRFFRQSWREVRPGDIANTDLRSQLRSNRLNQCGELLQQIPEEQSADAEASSNNNETPSSPKQSESDLKLGLGFNQDLESNVADSGKNIFEESRDRLSRSLFDSIPSPIEDQATPELKKTESPEPDFLHASKQSGDQSYEAYFVCVTARHEASRVLDDNTRNEIQTRLTAEIKKNLVARFHRHVLSTVVIRSFYWIPSEFDVQDSESDESDFNVPESPDERTLAWMNAWEMELAIKKLDRAIQHTPDQANYFRDRAYFKFRLRQFDAAVADYNEAIRCDSSNAKAHLERAQANYARSQNPQDAIPDLDEAIRLEPKLGCAYLERSRMQLAGHLYDQALAAVNTAIQIEPKAIHFAVRGNIYLGLNDKEHALADFNEAIRMDDKCIEAYKGRMKLRGTASENHADREEPESEAK